MIRILGGPPPGVSLLLKRRLFFSNTGALFARVMALRPVGEMSFRNIFADTTSEGSLQVQDQRQTETELRVAHALVGNIRE